jgi:hypothetical protein
MDQWPVMWIDIILRKPKVHLRYKSMVLKIATQEEAPQRRPNMEPRGMLTSKDSTEESSSEGTDNSKELSSSETSSHSQRRRKRRKQFQEP